MTQKSLRYLNVFTKVATTLTYYGFGCLGKIAVGRKLELENLVFAQSI